VVPDALAKDLGLNGEALAQLAREAEGIVSKGELPSLQIALARHGRLALELTFGQAQTCSGIRPATNDTLYQGFSTTKAVIASAIWLLVEEQGLDVTVPVAQWIPEFGANGKDNVLIEQLLTHTAGFPLAPFRALDWDDRTLRLQRFADWELEWEPGSRFTYHAASSLWVIAEIIERCARMDFREFLRSRILAPLGLHDFHLGLPMALEERVAHLVWVGKPRSAKSRSDAAVQPPVNDAPEEKLAALYNSRAYHAVGVPGGGGIMTASNLALFYQGLLQGGPLAGDRIWSERTIAWARQVRTGDLIDPMTGKTANRGLGIVVAGDQDRLFRGFAEHNSANAYGHLGMGGQVGWADPDTGLSFAFLTNGHERNPLRAGMRAMSMSERAVACVQT
jgi:CubicO group peptidase (beta-lactamase class C family)